VSQGNVDVVGRSFEAFNARDVNELVSLSTPDCEWLPFRAQLEGIVYRGHEGVRRFVSDIEDDWEVYQVDPLEFHDRGELVAVVGQVRAVGRGSSVDIDSIAGFVFELQCGRIRHVTSHSNPDAAREAVGVESG
jgi:ketosteroid isomerase-like protein